ncbi:Mur ligase family protein [Propionivibrio sp.]|uniref:Mur ligase family protein n=1 Tax=Propionivibrio sp. TaxID=2212460 RepID=UPI0039E44BF2
MVPLRRLESFTIFLGKLVFRIRKPFIIAVTGSVGKSTTTALIASVLASKEAGRIVGPVGSTVENMNDNLGVAATLLRFDGVLELPWNYLDRMALLLLLPFRAMRVLCGSYPKVMVLECGVGDTANLHELVALAPPTVSVVTRIGAAHLQKLKTIDGVIEEKGALVRAVPPSGLVVLGQDHEYVARFEQMARAPVVKVPGQGVELSQNIARAICRYMGIPDEVVASALKDFKNPKGRLNRLQVGDILIIDDTYNANPLSMKLGLDTLAREAGQGTRKLAVLGGMSELGENDASFHEEIAAYARSRSDLLVGVGDLARRYNPDIWFETSEACADQIAKLVHPGDCVFVKGSASTRMSRVVERLREVA